MADTLRILGQSLPAANTLTSLYTVGVSGATISSLVIANQTSAAGTFRVSVAVSGAADTLSQYLYYDTALKGNSTFIATVGFTLGLNDVVRIQSSNNNMSFNAFGVEVS